MKQPPTNESAADGPVTWDDVASFQEELKRTTRALLAQEGNAGTVHTTQLLNSALKKLVPKQRDWREVSWKDRDAFFKDAHFAMRRRLIDYARRRKVRKEVKAGGFESEAVGPLVAAGALNLDRLVDQTAANAGLAEAVDRALAELDRLYPGQRLAEIVQHRCFEGLTQVEIARLLGFSERTVRDREKLAYALLRQDLTGFFTKPALSSSSQPKTAKAARPTAQRKPPPTQ